MMQKLDKRVMSSMSDEYPRRFPQINYLANVGSYIGASYMKSVVYENKIYGIPGAATCIAEYNVETGELIKYGELDSVGGKWSDGIIVSDKLYLLPFYSNKILIFDLIAKSISYLDVVNSPFKWSKWCLVNNRLYGVPYQYSQVLEFEPESNTISYFGDTELSAGKGDYSDAVVYSGKIYAIPFWESNILEIDIDNKTLSYFGNTEGDMYKCSIEANDRIYAFPKSGNKILEINPNDKNILNYPIDMPDGVSSMTFAGCEKLGQKIYAIPGAFYSSYSQFLEFDFITKEIKLFGKLSEDISTYYWGGATKIDNTIYAFPWEHTNILELNISELMSYSSRFFSTSSSWNNDLLKSSVGDVTLKPVKQNCVKTSGTEFLQSSEVLIDGNKWAFEFDMSERIPSTGGSDSDIMLGSSISSDNRISFRDPYDNDFFSARVNANNFNCSSYDTSAVTEGKITVIHDSQTISFYVNDVLVDSVASTEPFYADRLFNYSNTVYGFAGKANDFKIWVLDSYEQTEINKALLDTVSPKYRFPLNEYKSSDLSSDVIFTDVVSGATATLSGIAANNLSKRDGASWNLKKGFSNCVQSNGTDDYFKSASLTFTDEITAVVWFKVNEIDTGQYSGVIGDWNTANTRSWLIAKNDTDNKYGFWVSSNGLSVTPALSDEELVTGKWYCLVGRYDGSEVSIWLDGIKQTSTQSLNGDLYQGDSFSLFSFHTSYFNGIDFRRSLVYSRALTDAEISNFTFNSNSLISEFIPTNKGSVKDTVRDLELFNKESAINAYPLTNIYLPAKADESGKDITGLTLTNIAVNNGKGHNGCEQLWQCPDIDKSKDASDIWKSTDGTIVNDVDVTTLSTDDNGNIEITKDDNGNVTDLKIKL